MFGHAIKYFKKSMTIFCERSMHSAENEEKDDVFKKCAFNLAIIHKKMGNKRSASQLIRDFL